MRIEADLILYNGNIYTMNPQNPKASAIAVKSYKILAVGEESEVADLVSTAKRVVDLGGQTVLPGFIDAHTHLTSSGIKSGYIPLHHVKSVEDVKQILKTEIPRFEEGQWIMGYGYDESEWSERRFLTSTDLDAVSKVHPIMMTRVDGHLVSVNSMGLEKLGIELDQEGVDKDKKGRPTGVLKDIEGIFELVKPTGEEILNGVVAGNKIANEHGITTAVDNAPSGYLRYVREIERKHELTTRMVMNVPVEQMKHMIKLGLTSAMGSPMVKIGGVKIFTDGSIGAATAALSKDYLGQKGNKGMLLFNEKDYARTVRQAVENDIQTVTHAIGDAAIEMVIATFEDLVDKSRIRDQRHRIEHAEIISEWQIRRAAGLGLILSMQPNFVGRWQLSGGLYEDRLDEEIVRGMNMFRVALDNGARVCFGSDGMPYGPLYGIWSATTHPNERVRITIEEAIRCYTMESAYASFLERTLGSISIGKRADFVVLSKDIMTLPPEQIQDINVEMTFVGGIMEYSSVKS
ncbi:MAG: amidohydrolase [Candidatus Thorarchaeota archaeon]